MRVTGFTLVTLSAVVLLVGLTMLALGNADGGLVLLVSICPACLGVVMVCEDYRRELRACQRPVSCQERRWFGAKTRRRYWLTNDKAVTKAAMRQILCNDWGMEIILDNTAFAKDNDEVLLCLCRAERIVSQHDDFVLKVGNSAGLSFQSFHNPDDAIDAFIELWEKWEVGEYHVTMTSSNLWRDKVCVNS